MLHTSDTDNCTLIARYLERIGLDPVTWRVDFKANPLAAITTMISSHVSAIPFENIDGLAFNNVYVDAEHVVAKLLEEERGGYCHEHSTLLAEVLDLLKVPVKRIGARIYVGRELDAAPNKAHQALLATIDGRDYLIDAGFGGTTPPAPLALDETGAVDTRVGQFRIIPVTETDYPADAVHDIEYMLQFRKNATQEFSSMYGFGTTAMPQSDIDMANFFTSTHPQHPFTQQPVMAIHKEEGKVTLNGLKLRTRDGERELNDVNEFTEAVEQHFGIILEPDTAQRSFNKAQQKADLDN